MAIITLTSDLGTTDYYLAAVKGAILSQIADVTMVDISHDIPKYDLVKTAFIVSNAWKHFPMGTIHIVGVEPLESEDAALIAISAGGHYFIGADNGVFSLILNVVVDEIVQLRVGKDAVTPTFPMLDVFVPAACHLARGGTLEVIGRKRETLRQMLMQSPPIGSGHIKANIIYIDSFGNLITNLTREMFDDAGRGEPFEIQLKSKDIITRITKNYNDQGPSSLIAIFGHSGFLEIALVRGSAAKLLGLKVSDTIRIEFYAS